MDKKIGPLKLWQILAVGAVVGLYMLYKNRQSSSSNPTGTPTGPYIDPTTGQLIDPTTGQPFATGGGGFSGASDVSGQMVQDPLSALANTLAEVAGINAELAAYGFPGTGGVNGGTTTDGTAGSASGGTGATIIEIFTGQRSKKHTKPKPGKVAAKTTAHSGHGHTSTHHGGGKHVRQTHGVGNKHVQNPGHQRISSHTTTSTGTHTGGVSAKPPTKKTTHHRRKRK